jgi:hypothetical protein
MGDHAATEASVCDGNSKGAGVVDAVKLPAPLAGGREKSPGAAEEQSRAELSFRTNAWSVRYEYHSDLGGRYRIDQSIVCVCVCCGHLFLLLSPMVFLMNMFYNSSSRRTVREREGEVFTPIT